MNTIFWRGTWLTRTDFERRIGRLCSYLVEAGVTTGERVAVLSQNHPILLEGIYAALRHGWIHVPLNYRLPALELAPLVKYIEPRVLIYAIEFAAQAEEAKRQLPELQLVILEEIEEYVITIGQSSSFIGNENYLLSEGEACLAPTVQNNFFRRGEVRDHARQVRAYGQDSLAQLPNNEITSSNQEISSSPFDTVMLLFTGGTTGIAKAAQITREMFETNISDTITSWGLEKNDCTIIATPMFHAGVNALATPLLELGGRVAILEKFSPQAYLQMVEDCGCTLLFAVPTMFQKLIEFPVFEDFDFSQIKYAITGGSPCPNHIREAFYQKGVQFKLGYGMTEAGVNCFTQNLENAQLKPSSVGLPIASLKAVLRDKNGNEATTGELTLSGRQIMGGYWKKPLETNDVLKTINGETWLFTGDIATRDSDGHYSIIGRSKEMIISGGENIYPFEIEGSIYEHPNILECAVLGVPDADWGEVALAAVVTRESLSLEELQNFLRPKLASYKIPKHYLFLSELPKSATGKILKHVLQKQFIAESRATQDSPLQESTLILLHGNYASSRWWTTFLASAPCLCFAPTLPGFASIPPLEDTNIKTICDWLETKIQHLERPVLLGHSLGGVLALELAARDPSKYAALVLVSSPSLTGFPHNPAGDAIRALIPTNHPLLEQIFKVQSPSLPAHSGELWEAILDDAQALPFAIGNGFAVELGTWNRLESAQSLASLPTLILAGQADVLVTPSITQELTTQLPHAIFKTRENIGHWLPLEDPEWFLTQVKTFLEDL